MHERAAENADEYDRHRCRQAFRHQRPHDVVDQIYRHHVARKQNGHGRIHRKPAPYDQRNQDDRGADLNYSEEQNQKAEQTCRGNAGEQQADARQ